ncbi:MAG: hypothetical protein ABII22_02335 [Candidatus Micrarchaeota archaeon]
MKVCIICEKEVKGSNSGAKKVKIDVVIKAIRSMKSFLKVAKNNGLYVCKKDFESYRKKREKFERDMVLVSAIAAIVVLVLIGIPLLSGRLNLLDVFASLFLGVLLLAFGVIFRYTPAIEGAGKIKGV